ncbi:MAG: hypothetical protein MUF28_14825 [Ignavibacterium sp.]|nr:hypothetical protein [Ignavibacterium sp.]
MRNVFKILFIVFQILFSVILFVSCASAPKSDFQNHYYAADYEAKSFEDVSMDICYPNVKYDYNSGLDSTTVSMQTDFDKSFKKYFPESIKMFSTVNKIGWLYYDTNFSDEPILYDSISTDGKYVYTLSPPDSLTFFQKQSDSDFLLLVQYMMFTGNKIDDNKYESIVTINYSLWNNTNLDVVAIDELTTRMSFNKLGNKWPFRGVIMKLASEIFERLLMFEK